MSNTVITNYTDLNGPSTKTDSSVVVIVNKDGSLSVDQNLLGTLMGKLLLKLKSQIKYIILSFVAKIISICFMQYLIHF